MYNTLIYKLLCNLWTSYYKVVQVYTREILRQVLIQEVGQGVRGDSPWGQQGWPELHQPPNRAK